MNKQELREALRRERIRDDAYDLDGGHLPERLTLADAHGRWFLYYSERAIETGKKEFSNEAEACEYLLRNLKRDRSAHV